jgi:hypothetical protein
VKITIKIIGLIILLIFLYFIEMLIFLVIFGEGGQASQTMNNGLTKLVMYILPLVIIGGISYRVFGKK